MSNTSTNKVVLKSLGIVFGMFAFGFALVPLYDIICDVTGLNGKTGDKYEQADTQIVDESRLVTVQFTASNNAGMPWLFEPVVRSMEVHPGQQYEVMFFAKNPTDKDMVAQAVPSLSPGTMNNYFHKTECFCFIQQPLKAGESIQMPLRFIVDKDLPKRATKLTLSYTLFDLPQVAAANNKTDTSSIN